jgi:hypothetical protein
MAINKEKNSILHMIIQFIMTKQNLEIGNEYLICF